MRPLFFNLSLWLGWALILSAPLTYGEQRTAQQMAKGICSGYLKKTPSDQSRLLGLLRHPDTLPRTAIKSIITYLKSHPEWNGEKKHKEWQEFVHIYNHRRDTFWINAPFLRTAEGDIVCWGETRGHLLIFRKDGQIFMSYNPNRPNPHGGGPDGYQIDWNDPTLN